MRLAHAVRKTLVQFLTDPRLWRIVAGSTLVSLIFFSGFWYGIYQAVSLAVRKWPDYVGWFRGGEGEACFGVTLLLAVILFHPIFIIIATFFQEAVVAIVEAKYYPGLPPARSAPLATAIFINLRWLLRVLIINLLALPIYLALSWVAGAGIYLSLAVNGMLVGREYFEIVASRRLSRPEMDASRRKNRGGFFLTGICIAGLMFIPGVNLFAPVLGIAVMVHVFHGRRQLEPPIRSKP